MARHGHQGVDVLLKMPISQLDILYRELVELVSKEPRISLW